MVLAERSAYVLTETPKTKRQKPPFEYYKPELAPLSYELNGMMVIPTLLPDNERESRLGNMLLLTEGERSKVQYSTSADIHFMPRSGMWGIIELDSKNNVSERYLDEADIQKQFHFVIKRGTIFVLTSLWNFGETSFFSYNNSGFKPLLKAVNSEYLKHREGGRKFLQIVNDFDTKGSEQHTWWPEPRPTS